MRMKSGPAVGPDDIPVEIWNCLGEVAVKLLTYFTKTLDSMMTPQDRGEE